MLTICQHIHTVSDLIRSQRGGRGGAGEGRALLFADAGSFTLLWKETKCEPTRLVDLWSNCTGCRLEEMGNGKRSGISGVKPQH